MKDLLTYKDFIGTVHYSTDDEVLYGKIEGIDDLITFEGKTVPELKKAFREAVEDYITICKEKGKTYQKSFKGSFNVRLTPDLHRKAYRVALLEGISLNQLVQKSLEEKVDRKLKSK